MKRRAAVRGARPGKLRVGIEQFGRELYVACRDRLKNVGFAHLGVECRAGGGHQKSASGVFHAPILAATVAGPQDIAGQICVSG